jgi:hypothetical protein
MFACVCCTTELSCLHGQNDALPWHVHTHARVFCGDVLHGCIHNANGNMQMHVLKCYAHTCINAPCAGAESALEGRFSVMCSHAAVATRNQHTHMTLQVRICQHTCCAAGVKLLTSEVCLTLLRITLAWLGSGSVPLTLVAVRICLVLSRPLSHSLYIPKDSVPFILLLLGYREVCRSLSSGLRSSGLG